MRKLKFRKVGKETSPSLSSQKHVIQIGKVDVSAYEGRVKQLRKYFVREPEIEETEAEFLFPFKPNTKRDNKDRRWKNIVQKKIDGKMLHELQMEIEDLATDPDILSLKHLISNSSILRQHVGLDFNEELKKVQQYYLNKIKEIPYEPHRRILINKLNAIW